MSTIPDADDYANEVWSHENATNQCTACGRRIVVSDRFQRTHDDVRIQPYCSRCLTAGFATHKEVS